MALTVVSIYSLLRHASIPPQVTLFLAGHEPMAEKWISRLGVAFPKADLRLQPISVPDPLEGHQDHLPTATYLRLRLPEFFDTRTIYLDGDTLIRGDIAELHQADLSGRVLGAIRDSELLRSWNRQSRRRLFGPGPTETDKLVQRMRGLFNFERYVNAGVLVLALDTSHGQERLSELNDIPAAMAFCISHDMVHHDQDWFNHQLSNEIAFLPPEWNVLSRTTPHRARYLPQPDRCAVVAAVKCPKLIHFAGPDKPYRRSTPPQDPRKASWWRWFHEDLDALAKIVGPGVTQALISG